MACQPFYGRFCDIWSRKAVLLSAMAFFFVGTLGCTFSSSLGQLIAFRALQGIRSTGFNCAAFIIIADIVSRAVAFATRDLQDDRARASTEHLQAFVEMSIIRSHPKNRCL